MKRKLQVFISSTYTDLIEERQAAVEAILEAGHIPAGMELFSAGDESQLDVIYRWIDESDVFLLIFGGRYGTLEPKSGKSYIQLEYEYAISSNKPFFAVIMTDDAIRKKVQIHGPECMEVQNNKLYVEFKGVVKSKMCKFFDDIKDIKIAIFKTLTDFQSRYNMPGWISGKDFYDSERYVNEISRLLEENTILKDKERELLQKIAQIRKGINDVQNINVTDPGDLEDRVERIIELLNAQKIEGGKPTWISNDDPNDPKSEEDRTIVAKKPRGEFEPYYFLDKEENINFIAFIYVDDDTSFNLNTVLADIRIMLEDYKDVDEEMEYRFILVNMGFTEDLKNKCYLFFDVALQKAEIESKDQFILEIWDSPRLLEIEKEIGLILNLN